MRSGTLTANSTFAAWLWTTGTHQYLRGTIDLPDDSRIDADRGWLDYVDRQANSLRTPSPYSPHGGHDPFHLSTHIDGPLRRRQTQRNEISLDCGGDRRAVLITNTMTGWYQALLDAEALPGDAAGKSWRVEVVVRPVGRLGTFRRSRSTGLWHSGKHRHHLAGN